MRNSITSFLAAMIVAALPIARAVAAPPPASPSMTRIMVVADTSDESSDLLTVAVAGTPLQKHTRRAGRRCCRCATCTTRCALRVPVSTTSSSARHTWRPLRWCTAMS